MVGLDDEPMHILFERHEPTYGKLLGYRSIISLKSFLSRLSPLAFSLMLLAVALRGGCSFFGKDAGWW
jgi:hypothetical protein